MEAKLTDESRAPEAPAPAPAPDKAAPAGSMTAALLQAALDRSRASANVASAVTDDDNITSDDDDYVRNVANAETSIMSMDTSRAERSVG